MKKLIAMILATVMLVMAFASCAKKESTNVSENLFLNVWDNYFELARIENNDTETKYAISNVDYVEISVLKGVKKELDKESISTITVTCTNPNFDLVSKENKVRAALTVDNPTPEALKIVVYYYLLRAVTETVAADYDVTDDDLIAQLVSGETCEYGNWSVNVVHNYFYPALIISADYYPN